MAYRWLSVNAIQDVRGISGLNLIELNRVLVGQESADDIGLLNSSNLILM